MVIYLIKYILGKEEFLCPLQDVQVLIPGTVIVSHYMARDK